MIQTFLEAFLPLFVAISVFGILPVFLSITEGMTTVVRRRTLYQGLAAASVISVIFLIAGDALFRFLGITENDFRVGGGVVLLVMGITDLLFSDNQERRRHPDDPVGIVPIGIPLIMGPAALTTIVIIQDSLGFLYTLASLLTNLLLVWLVFIRSEAILKLIGVGGSKAVAKVFSLFLTAIAVMMIRVGITNFQ